MLLSELLWTQVRDGNDRVLGVVHDVRVREERGTEGLAGLSIQGLVVGPRRALRVASTQQDLHGPLIFKLFDNWAERRLQMIPWNQVESVERGLIRVRRPTRG